MKSFLLLATLCSLLATAGARETAHESLALSDGRSFAQAKIISETPLTVVIQVGTRIHQVEKKLLPADVLAQWPVNEARAARDAAEVKRKAEREAEGIRKAKLVAEAGRKEQIEKAIAYAEKTKQPEPKPEDTAAQREEAERIAAWTYHGLLIRGVVSSYGEIYVYVSNHTTSDIRFPARELRFLAKGAAEEDSFTGTYVRADGVDEPIVKAGQSRIFGLGRNGTASVETVHWQDREERYPVHVLYRQDSQVAMGDEHAAQRREQAKALARGDMPENEIIAALRAATSPWRERLRAK